MTLFSLMPMYPLPPLPQAIEVFVAIVSALMLSWSLSLAVLQQKHRGALMGARELPLGIPSIAAKKDFSFARRINSAFVKKDIC